MIVDTCIQYVIPCEWHRLDEKVHHYGWIVQPCEGKAFKTEDPVYAIQQELIRQKNKQK